MWSTYTHLSQAKHSVSFVKIPWTFEKKILNILQNFQKINHQKRARSVSNFTRQSYFYVYPSAVMDLTMYAPHRSIINFAQTDRFLQLFLSLGIVLAKLLVTANEPQLDVHKQKKKKYEVQLITTTTALYWLRITKEGGETGSRSELMPPGWRWGW